ncbi:MAG: alpha/beta hydrolase-fold protein [Luteolibacter sp.]
MLVEFTITSDLLSKPRAVWVQQPLSGQALDCLILLDGEMYRDRVMAPAIILEEQESGRIPLLTCVHLSLVDTATRHADLACNETFSQFLSTDLIDWIEQTVGAHERYFIGGLSLGGLAAAFTALRHPGVFSGALCQSPSAWWNDEWLSGFVGDSGSSQERFWISVGDKEIQKGIAHPPSGMLQKVGQVESVRRLVAALTKAGHDVWSSEFHGGHDPVCWGAELPEAISWLMTDREIYFASLSAAPLAK